MRPTALHETNCCLCEELKMTKRATVCKRRHGVDGVAAVASPIDLTYAAGKSGMSDPTTKFCLHFNALLALNVNRVTNIPQYLRLIRLKPPLFFLI